MSIFSLTSDIHQAVKLLHELLEVTYDIDANLRGLRRQLFPIPNQLTLTIEGVTMGAPISVAVGKTVTFTPTEFDTLTTPPTPFPIVPANQVYTQDVTTSGTLVINPDGTASLTGTAAGVVTVTDTDSVSNPALKLSDSVVVTFFVPAEVPNQLVLTGTSN